MAQKPVNVIDAHVHIFDPAKISYPWLVNAPPISHAHLFSNYYAASDIFELESFVFVEVAAADEVAMAEAEWLSSATATEPKLGGVVAQALLDRGSAVREDLEKLAAMPKVKGVRRLFAPFQTDLDFPIRPAFVEGVKLLPEFNLSFDLCGTEANMPNMVKLAAQCPDVTFILDHIGKPLIATGEWEPWRTHARELAAMDNVYAKISGLPIEAGGPHIDKIAPYVHEAIGMFGIDRVMFGSDFPVQELAGGFTAWFNLINSVMSAYPAEERAKYFSENARRVYRIG